MKAAILGINGYIGSNLAWFLHQQGWSISGYDLATECKVPGIRYQSLDVTRKEEYEKLPADIDYCFYFSGITGTANAYKNYDPFIEVNEKGLLHLLSRIKETQSGARVIFPSTRLVYKGEQGQPLNEEATKEFKTIYALNKWFGECVLNQYARYFGIKYTIFRLCVPYGTFLGTDYSYGTIGFFLKKAMLKENVVLYGNGSQQRTFSHMEDICRQIFLATQKQESINEVFNIAGETFSVKEVATKVAEKFSVRVEYTDWPGLDLKLESGDTIFNGNKIAALLENPVRNSFASWLAAL